MSQYVLDHHLEGEKKRLALMSQLLDPMHRRYIESLGISRDARVLEIGCGNGSMSVWVAEHIASGGQIVAVDLDLSLVDDAHASRVEFRQGDIVAGAPPTTAASSLCGAGPRPITLPQPNQRPCTSS